MKSVENIMLGWNKRQDQEITTIPTRIYFNISMYLSTEIRMRTSSYRNAFCITCHLDLSVTGIFPSQKVSYAEHSFQRLIQTMPACVIKDSCATQDWGHNHRNTWHNTPDSKVHGANMGPLGSSRPQMGPMLAPWTLLSGTGSGCTSVWFIGSPLYSPNNA